MNDWKVWRCRWFGRRVHGLFGWFHKPTKCDQRPTQSEASRIYDEDRDRRATERWTEEHE